MTLLQKSNWTQGETPPISGEIFNDEIVDNWFLMSSIWPIIGIISTYLVFVLKIGPKMMEKRKPPEMKTFMLAYNLFQVFQNGRLVWLFFTHPGGLEYASTMLCSPLGNNNNPFWSHICDGAWYFFMAKLIDLTDTVIIVLKKKSSQMPFFHVYHHSNMVLSSWLYLKYMKGEQLVLVGILNAFVHVTIYSYCFLTTFGPAMKRHLLWWKKYIELLEIAQFVIIIVFLSSLLGFSCNIRVSYTLYAIAETFGFLVLFMHFYITSYKQKKRTSDTSENNGIKQVVNAKKNE